MLFSEREFAVARPSVCRSPVCRLSVTLMHPTQAVVIFGNFSTAFGDRPRGTPPSGELNARGVAKYSVLDLSKAISRKWRKIRGKLVLITNRKSHMSFRLVPKSVTLNDLERRSDRYLSLIHI